jgi:glyoxylase-like metal-dependent hydrolase (beta-lactamase superfamily II)
MIPAADFSIRFPMLRLSLLVFSLAIAASSADSIQTGTLPAAWITGGPDCATVPDWQVHAYNDDFYILRESGCTNYEKPFLYLIFGGDKALLEDTGAGPVHTAAFVQDLLAKWAKKKKRAVPPLMVVHSHSHGDHIAGDKELKEMPGVNLISPTVEAIQAAAGIAKWPDDPGTIDLGGRVLDVLAIPGHNNASIALYDRRTALLLTGDSLYPGRLYVNAPDVPVYAASARRLADFVRLHPVAHVLGTHIEQSRTPYVDYPTGTVYQPEEHSLELTRAHVLELDEAFTRRKDGDDTPIALPDFTVAIRAPRPARGR